MARILSSITKPQFSGFWGYPVHSLKLVPLNLDFLAKRAILNSS